jgi:hypothetical protein
LGVGREWKAGAGAIRHTIAQTSRLIATSRAIMRIAGKGRRRRYGVAAWFRARWVIVLVWSAFIFAIAACGCFESEDPIVLLSLVGGVDVPRRPFSARMLLGLVPNGEEGSSCAGLADVGSVVMGEGETWAVQGCFPMVRWLALGSMAV